MRENRFIKLVLCIESLSDIEISWINLINELASSHNYEVFSNRFPYANMLFREDIESVIDNTCWIIRSKYRLNNGSCIGTACNLVMQFLIDNRPDDCIVFSWSEEVESRIEKFGGGVILVHSKGYLCKTTYQIKKELTGTFKEKKRGK